MNKKQFTLIIAALAAALWFTGCEQDLGLLESSGPSALVSRSAAAIDAPAQPDKWTQITDATFTSTFNGLSVWAVSAAGDKVVAGGDKGAAAYSEDAGVTWTALPADITQGYTINGIANDGANNFVIVADNGALAYTLTGPSGKWTTLDSTATQITDRIYAAAYGASSGRFVIGGGYGQAAYSDNGGQSWTAIKDLGPIFDSPDNSTNIRSIASVTLDARTDIFVAVGGRSGPAPMYNAAAYSLSNGDNGSWVANPNGVFCRGLASDGTKTFVGCGYDMQGTNAVYTDTSNLANWTKVSTATTGVGGWLDGITYGGGYFVAGGLKGSVTYTANPGSNWTYVDLSGIFTGYVDALSFATITSRIGRFYAVGDNGKGAYADISIVIETDG